MERTQLHRSLDFGSTWTDSPALPYLDAGLLSVDSVAPADRVIVFGDGQRRTVTTSSDGGASFGKALVALPDLPGPRKPGWFLIAAHAARLGDGTLGVVYLDPYALGAVLETPPAITFSRTSGSGEPLGTPVVVARISKDLSTINSNAARSRGVVFGEMPLASLAVGSGSAGRQRLFVAWHDSVEGVVHILLSYSDDSGKTWSAPRVADNEKTIVSRTSRLQILAAHPSIAVNRNGTVGLLWATDDGRCWRFAVSTDHGSTFDPSIALKRCGRPHADAQESDPHVVPKALSSHTPPGVTVRLDNWKDWTGIVRGTLLVASADSSFHALWASHDPPDVGLYSSRIVVGRDLSDHAARRTKVLQAKMVQIKDGAWIDYLSADYEHEAEQFVMRAVVVVRRDKLRTWPLVVRVSTLTSGLGAVTAVGADNGMPGAGASWVFDDPDPKLPPQTSAGFDQSLKLSKEWTYSSPRVLRFKIARDELTEEKDQLPPLDVKATLSQPVN